MSGGRDLRVGIVGYGLAGSVFHAPLVHATEGLSVAAIVTANAERSARAARDFPDARILATPDEIWTHRTTYELVVIASPNRFHVPLATASIENGIPVVVDKPFAPSSDAARGLIEASRRRGVPLTVFQNRRWDGDFLTLRRIVDEGLVGRIVRFESHFDRYRPVPKAGAWRELADPEEAGGLLFDLGSHLIDQAMLLFGKPKSVYAEMGIYRAAAEVDDDTFVALMFEGDIHAHLGMSVASRILGPRFRLNGLRGSYVKYGLDPQEPQLAEGLGPGNAKWGIEPREVWGTLSTDVAGLHVEGQVETAPGQYEMFYARLRDALESGDPLPVDPSDSVAGLEVIEAAALSAREGRVVGL